MTKKIHRLILVLFFLLSCGKSTHEGRKADCDIDNNACIKTLQNKKIHFDITPKPVKVMKPLTFTIKLINFAEDHQFVVLDLTMPGMYMGFNQFVLNRKDSNLYEGTGVIPTCPQGKTLWKAKVIIKEETAAEFLFNVHK